MILSKVLSLKCLRINISGLAIFPATYLVLGFFAAMALDITLAMTEGGDEAPFFS